MYTKQWVQVCCSWSHVGSALAKSSPNFPSPPKALPPSFPSSHLLMLLVPAAGYHAAAPAAGSLCPQRAKRICPVGKEICGGARSRDGRSFLRAPFPLPLPQLLPAACRGVLESHTTTNSGSLSVRRQYFPSGGLALTWWRLPVTLPFLASLL